MSSVLDLDVLRPKDARVVLGGNDIDVSFIPLALTWDINDLLTQSSALDQEKLNANDTDEVKKAFNLSVTMCAIFCVHQYPEMDEAWFEQHASLGDITALGVKIREALVRAYEGIDPKN